VLENGFGVFVGLSQRFLLYTNTHSPRGTAIRLNQRVLNNERDMQHAHTLQLQLKPEMSVKPSLLWSKRQVINVVTVTATCNRDRYTVYDTGADAPRDSILETFCHYCCARVSDFVIVGEGR